jgi:hypothetical protein
MGWHILAYAFAQLQEENWGFCNSFLICPWLWSPWPQRVQALWQALHLHACLKTSAIMVGNAFLQ